MTFKKTVQSMMQENPFLFKTGHDVVRFLFFKLGNGYVWHDGELVLRNTVSHRNDFVDPRHPTLPAICNIPFNIRPDWLQAVKLALTI